MKKLLAIFLMLLIFMSGGCMVTAKKSKDEVIIIGIGSAKFPDGTEVVSKPWIEMPMIRINEN